MESPQRSASQRPAKHRGGRGRKRPPPPVAWTLSVRPVRGAPFDLVANDCDSIARLRQRLGDAIGVPADKLCFLWCGSRSDVWSDDLTLSDVRQR